MDGLVDRLRQFREARRWVPFHTPEALARAVMVEAGELNELYLWGEMPSLERVEDEVADVLIYCLNLCDVLGSDPSQIVQAKIDKNETRFPVEGE